MSSISICFLVFLIEIVFDFDISTLKVNHFEEQQNLYYVNAMNSEDNDLYFEFWGEVDSTRYFIGKKNNTEESIKFGEEEIFSIDTHITSTYHDSIIINYNEQIYVFSMNYQYLNLIDFNNNQITSTETKNKIFAHSSGSPSHKNKIIKLKNNNYLLTIIMKTKCFGLPCHQISMRIFNFNSDSISYMNIINNKEKTVAYLNSTECFQTESEYIQCSFSNVVPSNYFTIGIYDLNFNEQETIHLGFMIDYTFTKIFHLKDEIGIYIFFDDRDSIYDENVPKIFIAKLNQNKNNLIDLFTTNCIPENNYCIRLNDDGNYILDNLLFSSDAVKINDSKFVVILTIVDTYNLLICLFDLYNNDLSLRQRYYVLKLEEINVKVSVNIRAFAFNDYFGIIFYDKNVDYPAYIFFNKPNENIDKNIIKNNMINLFIDASYTSYSLKENILLLENCFESKGKIKITEYPSSSESGVIIKSSELNSEISNNIELNLSDSLIFEPKETGAIPGEYFFKFDIIIEDDAIDTIYYGEGSTSDFETKHTYSSEDYKITYIVECYEKCATCDQLGSNSNYHCVTCNEDYPFNINNGQICLNFCPNFNKKDDQGILYCADNCDANEYIYKKAENEVYCLSLCSYNGEELYQDENELICYKSCSEATNGNNKLYDNKCVSQCPEDYIPNENNICTKEIKNTELIFSNSISNDIKTDNNDAVTYSNTQEISNNKDSDISQTTVLEVTNSEISNNECFVDIDSLINKYYEKNSKLEIELFEYCSIIYYVYSISTDLDTLELLNPNLTYINLKECEIDLFNENHLDSDKELLILASQSLVEKNSLYEFNYKVYINNRTQILNISSCGNYKYELSSPINDIEIYENALDLSDQGFDIFNLSSSFYYDICVSAQINDCDLTLSIRQNDIMPDNESICYDGCYYNGVNLTTKRISCLCDYNINQQNGNKTNQMEEAEENFLIYFLDMINYPIIVCYKLFFNFNNYFYNFGFYTGVSFFVIILILCISYYIFGQKSITLQYLNKMQKFKNFNQIKNNNKPRKSLEPIQIPKNILQNNSSKLTFRTQKKKSKTAIIGKNRSKNKRLTVKKNSRKNNNGTTIIIRNKFNINNFQRNSLDSLIEKKTNAYINQKNNIFEIKKKIQKNKNMNTIGDNDLNKNKEKNNEKIEYNELSYISAIQCDKRNIFQIFLSFLLPKLEIIQIIYYPREFSHKSLTSSQYLLELLSDLTVNALLFSDDVISQKYYNNGELLFFTTNILSIASNVISCFILYLLDKLINYYNIFEAAAQETISESRFMKIFLKISWMIKLKILLFYLIILILGLGCIYYIFIFCAIYKKIQENLFTNYLMSSLWSLAYTFGICLIVTIIRKIALLKGYKRLYVVSKYINENL